MKTTLMQIIEWLTSPALSGVPAVIGDDSIEPLSDSMARIADAKEHDTKRQQVAERGTHGIDV